MSEGDPARGGEARATLPAPVTSARALLWHPFFGLERRRTAVALAYAAGVVALFGIRYGARIVAVGDAPLEARWVGFDSLSAFVIVAATATVTAVPVAYAAWNGGPGLSFALPFVPIVPPDVVAGRYVFGLDWMIALTVGTAAAAVALYAADVRRTASRRPWRTEAGDALPFVTACLGIALVLSASFATSVPPDLRERYVPFAVLLVVPVAVVGLYWRGRVRRARRSVVERGEPARVDP